MPAIMTYFSKNKKNSPNYKLSMEIMRKKLMGTWERYSNSNVRSPVLEAP